jgi:hypothetical protein
MAIQHKNVLLYLAVGEYCAKQALFSLYSIVRVYRNSVPNFKILVFTNVSKAFDELLNVLNITCLDISENKLRSWKGAENNMMRAKIAAILEVLSTSYCNLLYIDSDCIVLEPIEKIFEMIESGSLFMHKPEWPLRTGRKKHPELIQKDQVFKLSTGECIPVNGDTLMSNAGVLGCSTSSLELVKSALDLYQQFYSLGPSWHLEQFAFSIIFFKTGKLRYCRREIFHYWHNKTLADKYINAMFIKEINERNEYFFKIVERFVLEARVRYYTHLIRVKISKNPIIYKIYCYTFKKLICRKLKNK